MSGRSARLARKTTEQEQIEAPAPAAKPSAPVGGLAQMSATASFQMVATPLPPAAVLADYRRELPTFPEDLRAEWLAQAAHRREMESLVVRAQTDVQRRGLTLAFVLALIAITAATCLAWLRGPAEAAAIGAVPAALFALHKFASRPSPQQKNTHP